MNTALKLRADVLHYMDALRVQGGEYGRYYYASGAAQPVVYASTYAAMVRHLLRDIDVVAASNLEAWVQYLQAHQENDGLFCDPLIYGEGWYADDPLWCGRPHLSCHVIVALACLGAVAQRPLIWLDQFLAPNRIEKFLEARDWKDRPAWVGNEVMNVGTLLQYARDFQSNQAAGTALERMLDWLDTNAIDSRTGMWGGLDVSNPIQRSHLVQAAYHIWPLYFYDRRPIPYQHAAMDTVLLTQNAQGSFGWGVHNSAYPHLGSACEDIDSIEPLVRFAQIDDYRRKNAQSALQLAAPWVLTNQNMDGGFVFMRHQPFSYGHLLMDSGMNESGMFPTWFRTLSLAYLGKAMPQSELGQINWQFCRCPGYQLWND